MTTHESIVHGPQYSCVSGRTSIDSVAADQVFRDELAAAVPSLRSFARGLCGSQPLADAMTRDAMALGWSGRASCDPGTDLKIWLLGILRNHFYAVTRFDGRVMSWDVGEADAAPANDQSSSDAAHYADIASTLQKLPAEQREVLMLVEGQGLSYAKAATVIGSTISTVQSRLACGREALGALIGCKS